MNIKKYRLLMLSVLFMSTVQMHTAFALNNNVNNKAIGEQEFLFYFDNEDLVDIINIIAAKRLVNILLPQGDNAIKQKVTIHFDQKMTLDDAWEFLYYILDLAGYAMVLQDDLYVITKSSKDTVREPLPLYIVPPEQLPDSDERIRYIHYFANVKVSDETNNEINAILKEVLPETATFKADPISNALLISDKANNIKAAMDIIKALDAPGYKEHMERMQLRYANADTVAALFNDQVLKTTVESSRLRPEARKGSEISYFSRHIRVVPFGQRNELILLGRQQDIERVREFIGRYIDVEPEQGKSLLHVYPLQYLDAESFAEVLTKVIEVSRSGGVEQARAGEGTPAVGPERQFGDVIIKADRFKAPGAADSSQFFSGNNLIIAARSDDWEYIRQLIEELDTPQRTVILEVLIADLTSEDIRVLANQMRNAEQLAFPNKTDFQFAMVDNIIIDPNLTNPQTIKADLLNLQFTDAASNPVSMAARMTPGSTALSFNDPVTGKTWNVTQILKTFNTRKVISHPHMVAVNNQKAYIEVGQERLVPGGVSNAAGSALNRQQEYVPAKLVVEILPRISSDNIINLQVDISIDQFIDANIADANKVTRSLHTNANIGSGKLFVIGGLTRTDTAADRIEVPFLSKIPLIGWFFKGRSDDTADTHLVIFISPTIIEARLRGGVSDYTRDYVAVAKRYAREGMLFDSLRDPITRLFFQTDQASQALKDIDDFIARDEFVAPELFGDSERERDRKRKENATRRIRDIDMTKREQMSIAQLSDEERNQKLKEMLNGMQSTEQPNTASSVT